MSRDDVGPAGRQAPEVSNGGQPAGGKGDRDQNFEAELERRLEILESPDYADPARRDLSGLDYLLLGVIVAVTVTAMYWWGY